MHVTNSASKGQVVAYLFGQDAVAASQTNVQLPTAIGEASQAVTGYTMPFDGDVVGLTYDLSAAGTTGTFTIGVTVGGTENDDTTMTVGTTTAGHLAIPRGTCRVSAGDLLGAEITTNGSWDGTTADLAVVVYVLLALDGI